MTDRTHNKMTDESLSKFEFTPDFQHDILRFVATDKKDGYRVLEVISDSYFTLLEDSIIAKALKDYYNKESRIPGRTMLIEELSQNTLNSRELIKELTDIDRKEIVDRARKLYTRAVQDGDKIRDKAVEFARFVEVSNIIESQNLSDKSDYTSFLGKLHNAMKIGQEQDSRYGTSLVHDIRLRQIKRRENQSIVPTPFRQINALTNAGGYPRHSVMVILDKPKKFKTGTLINFAIGYMKQRKKVLIFDLENGEDEYMARFEQNIAGLTKKSLFEGESDNKVAKQIRKYKRLGADVRVIRLPSLSTTTDDMSQIMRELYRDHGTLFNVVMVDYAALLASTTRKKEDVERIGDVYLDIANLAKEWDLDIVITAHHLKRNEAVTRRERTKYMADDIAKCIDIVRHVQVVYGLNRTQEEEEGGYQRLEIVEQRDGKPFGRAVFSVNKDTQTMRELTKSQLEEYEDQFWSSDEDLGDEAGLEEVSTGRVVRHTNDL